VYNSFRINGQSAFTGMGCVTANSHLYTLFTIKCSDFPGVFAAAHDFKTEWVVVKGIKDYADGSQSSNDEWGTFASVMAASVVANILSDAVIFEEWPYYNPGSLFSHSFSVVSTS